VASLWLLWAALVLGLGITAIGTLARASAEIEQRSRSDLADVAARTRAQIEAYLTERHNDARLLAGRDEVWRLLATPPSTGAPQHHALEAALLQTRQIYGYHAIQVIDTALRVRNSVPVRGLEELENNALQTALQTRQGQLVDMHVRADCQPCLGFVQPVFRNNDRGAEVLGAVYLEISAQRDLYRFLPTWPQQGPADEALLLRRESDTLVYLSALRQQPDAAVLALRRSAYAPDLLEALATNATAPRSLEGKDYMGVAVVGAATPIAGTPWHLVVKTSKASLQAPMQTLHWRFLGGAGAFVVLLGFAAALLWRVRHAEARSRALAREAVFASAKNIAVDGYVLLNDAGCILEANPALADMLGYTVESLTGRDLADIEQLQAPPRIQDSLVQLRQGKAAVVPTRWRHSDGHWVDLQASMVYLQDAGKGYFQGSLRNIGPELRRLAHEHRLRCLYEFQSAIHVAIHRALTRGEIFEAVCMAAVRSGGFLLAWVGRPATGARGTGCRVRCRIGVHPAHRNHHRPSPGNQPGPSPPVHAPARNSDRR
jgi:PAS domain S-box-containing protein